MLDHSKAARHNDMPINPATAPRVFLSFSSVHKQLVEHFRRQAVRRGDRLQFRDYSTENPVVGAWKTEAERLIRESCATICFVGEGTWRSDPVNWEIRKSAELGKKILAVYIESDDVQTPPALLEIGAVPMQWDLESIVDRLCNEH